MNQTMSQREQACILPSLALILYILHSLFIMLATFPALVSPCPTGSVYQFAHFFFPFLSFFFLHWRDSLEANSPKPVPGAGLFICKPLKKIKAHSMNLLLILMHLLNLSSLYLRNI